MKFFIRHLCFQFSIDKAQDFTKDQVTNGSKREGNMRPQHRSNPPEVIQPERKNVIGLVQEWPLSKKFSTGTVLLISIILFAFLIIQARTADQQLLYANLTMSDAVIGYRLAEKSKN